MKNRQLWRIVSICLLVTTVVFCALWVHEKNDLSDIEQLAQYGATESLAFFGEYRDTGDIGMYWSGVASFRSFENAFTLLNDYDEGDSDLAVCNAVFAQLLLHQEKFDACRDKLLETLSVLSIDVTDPRGMTLMYELRDLMEHG